MCIFQIFSYSIAYISDIYMSIMSEVFRTQLTDEEKEYFSKALSKFTHVTPKCHNWLNVPDKSGYGRINVKFRGKRKNLLAHRLAYFLANDCVELSRDLHCSHRCHNKFIFPHFGQLTF